MNKLTSLAFVPLLATSCATLRDQPTQDMVEYELKKQKKLVSFSTPFTSLELRDKAIQSECGKEQKTITTVTQVVGAGVIGVSSKYDYKVDYGQWPDGSSWVALRTDGTFHGSPMGYKIVPRNDGGSNVTVYAADRRQQSEIQSAVETGSLFFNWRKFSYPYD